MEKQAAMARLGFIGLKLRLCSHITKTDELSQLPHVEFYLSYECLPFNGITYFFLE